MTARELHYQGDNAAGVVGQIVGPTMLGQYLTVIDAEYDAATDMTTAHVRPSTAPELEASTAAWQAPAALGGQS